MRNYIVSFIIGFVIWMLLDWPFDLQHAIAGIFVAGFVAFLVGDLFTQRAHQFTLITRYIWLVYYVLLFFWQCLKANIDIASRIINPRLPINPGIIKVKTRLKSDTALAFLANAITFCPGTFCVDIKPEEGILYVHCLDVKATDIKESSRLIVDKFEKVLQKIFE